MVLDKSSSVPYAGRSLGGVGAIIQIFVFCPITFFLNGLYMNKWPYPIIDPYTALIPFTINSLDSGENNKTK